MKTIRIAALCLCALLLSNTSLFSQINVNYLTSHPWKFHYAFKPVELNVVNKADESNYVYLNFNKDNTFSIVTNDKLEKGTWKLSNNPGSASISFGFNNVDSWGVTHLTQENFVIYCKTDGSLIEYHFLPSNKKEDLMHMTAKIDEHIQDVKKMYLSFSNEDNKTYSKANQSNLNTIFKEQVNVASAKVETPTYKKVTGTSKVEDIIASVKIKEHDVLYADASNSLPMDFVINTYKTVNEINDNKTNSFDPNNIHYALKKEVTETDYIEIYVSGGGLKAGLNPKLHDRLMIFNSGVVQREYISKLSGKQVKTGKMDKESIVELANMIKDLGFFDFPKFFGCDDNNEACQLKLNSGPQPIPLTIQVTIGSQRNIVNIPIFAPGVVPNIVGYPVQIEKIVDAIYNYASL